MASADAEAPATTKRTCSTGRASSSRSPTREPKPPQHKLKDIAEVSSLFPNQGELTVKELFGWGKGDYVAIRQRAVGALFHMIQDSYPHGHVERNSGGEITEFHAYGAQVEHKHGEYDFLGGSWHEDLGDGLKKTHGALTAIDACAAMLQMIAEDVCLGRHRRLPRQERLLAVVERAAGRGGRRAREVARSRPAAVRAAPAGGPPRAFCGRT